MSWIFYESDAKDGCEVYTTPEALIKAVAEEVGGEVTQERIMYGSTVDEYMGMVYRITIPPK